MTATDDVKVIFPGTDVVLETCIVRVFPAGLKHLRKFSGELGGVLHLLVQSGDLREGQSASQFFAQLVPIALDHLYELIEDCTEVKPLVTGESIALEDIPHWEVPTLVMAWLEESFGEEKKWKPWVSMIETLVKKTTGQDRKISEIWSRHSSPPDTDETTSSTSSK